MPNSFIFFVLFSHTCTLRLSANNRILSFPFFSLSSIKYSMNRSVFTDLGKILKCSYPFSFEMPDSKASVGSLSSFSSIVMFSPGRAHSLFGTVLLVNIVSST